MTNVRTEDQGDRTPDGRLADRMVPRVSTMIAKGALLQERRLQVSENGEIRWVGGDVQASD